MMWYIWMAISLFAFIAAVVYWFSFTFVKKYKSGKMLTPFRAMFGGVVLSAFFCFLPIYFSLTGEVFKTVVYSLHNTFQLFTMDTEKGIIDEITCNPQWLSTVCAVHMSVLHIVAPVLTFGFVMSFFKNASASGRYLGGFLRDVYVFSEINENSLALGADIIRKNKEEKGRKVLIVYTNAGGKNSDVPEELIERAKELRAIIFNHDVVDINYGFHSRNAQITFFSIGKDETKNTDAALKLISRYSDRDNTRLYVFSSKVDGELLLTKADKGKIKVHRVNEGRSLINRILYENGQELFEHAKPMQDGDKKISAVIVGLGAHGTEMLKALSWYCQMDGYHVEIDAFDADEKAEDKFRAIAPELMSEDYNGVILPEEAEYTIRIHSGADVLTKSFADEIAKLKDTTYVFISLGSDELNIRTAAVMRMYFERIKIKPVIQSVVYNSDEKAALSGITNFKGQQYDIEFIGDVNTSYSEAVIMNSELEADALRRHMNWGKEEEFWQYEYNYNSSMASAIHAKARIACGIPGAGKSKDEMTEEEKIIIEKLEHRRWNAYMRSEGYIYSGSPEKKSRNDLAKMHHDLVDYSSLTDEEKKKDSDVGAE